MPGENVAAARRRQIGRRVGVDRGSAIGRRDHRIGTLQNDDSAARARCPPGFVEFAAAAYRTGARTRPRAASSRQATGSRRTGFAGPPQTMSARRRRAPPACRAARIAKALSRVSPPTPAPGPISAAFRRLSASNSPEIADTCDRLHDDPGQRRGIDSEDCLRGGDCDQPGADPRRGAGRQPSGPGHYGAARHERVPTGIFMALEPGPRQIFKPPVGVVLGGIAAPPPLAPCRQCRSGRARSRRNESRPGSSRCPGFLRKNVTVTAARGAAPRTSPVPPSTPLGTSTATTGTARRSSASMTSRATPSTGRASPAPKIASIASSAPSSADGDNGSTGPHQRAAARRRIASQLSRFRQAAPAAPASRVRRGCERRQNRRRHCCPARTRRRPDGAEKRRETASATARPAFSINSVPATPPAIVSRSASPICCGVNNAFFRQPSGALVM